MTYASQRGGGGVGGRGQGQGCGARQKAEGGAAGVQGGAVPRDGLAKLLAQGVTDMVRISDARMSGTAYGTVVLHVAPEAAASEALSSLTSEALIDALYARVLPRMKVELTLWMQDALEMQAKQLMSGVMQHLKEDFDMMLAEALRESLREALREAQAGQGER